MARFKETPVPRGAMFLDHIKKADLPKPVTPPPVATTAIPCAGGKAAASRPRAMKPAKSTLPATALNQNRSSSTASNKRKSQSDDESTLVDKSLALRSAKSTTADPKVTITGTDGTSEAPPAKQQKVNKASRRSLRLQKSTSDSAPTHAKARVTAPEKPARPARIQRKTVKAAQNAEEQEKVEQKVAVDLLQGPQVKITVLDSPNSHPPNLNSIRLENEDGSESHELYEVLPPARRNYNSRSASHSVTFDDQESAATPSSPHNISVSMSGMSPAGNGDTQSLRPVSFVYGMTSIQGADEELGTGSQEYGSRGEKNNADTHSATSGDSGYITAPAQKYPPLPTTPTQGLPSAMYSYGTTKTVPMMPATMPMMPMPAPYPMHWSGPPQTPWSAPEPPQTHTFIVNTKGQKVKGRATPRAPRTANGAPRSRNVANTYPRKQPFKAQIQFNGYPLETDPLPDDATLWDICRDYPNHLKEHVLLGFVQAEWSANELCACLKEDARKTLLDRPGKDKTMVFQKRLERIKKDLAAKGELDTLMHGPQFRRDGRPSWVKRGNVRRAPSSTPPQPTPQA